jgi:hypothetical protein
MKKQSIIVSIKLIAVVALMALFVVNMMTLDLRAGQSKNLSLLKLKTAFAQNENGGGACSGQVSHSWHASSNVESIWSKLSPSNPTSSSVQAANGTLSLGVAGSQNVTATVSGAGCSNKTYVVSVIHYECEGDWFSPKCLQREEHTLFSYQ